MSGPISCHFRLPAVCAETVINHYLLQGKSTVNILNGMTINAKDLQQN